MSRQTGGGPAVGSAEADARAADLLSASADGRAPAELAEQLLDSPLVEALATVAALGRSRQATAVPILLATAEIERQIPKELRKEARRVLHRLRALGLDVPRPTYSPSAPSNQRVPELVEAWATAADGVGSRAASLLVQRQLGGVYAVAMVLNDVVGMKSCNVDETTRKRYQESLARWRDESGTGWVQLPPHYAGQLIGEALELNRESGFTAPRNYQVYERSLGNPARPFEAAIIYSEVPPTEVNLDPELLEQSPTLLDEPELKGWFFGFDEVGGFALDMLQARQSQIVLSEQLKAERQGRIIGNAIRQVVTPVLQRALRRRLEEVAYLFWQDGRQSQAHLAVAAAQRLEPGAAMLNPFLQGMMSRSLELAMEVETARAPVELVRRSPYDPIE